VITTPDRLIRLNQLNRMTAYMQLPTPLVIHTCR